MKVGFIGLGTMGLPAARNIQERGFEMVVYDLRREAAETLLANGAAWADSPRELIERVDVVVSMVFGPVQIEQVVRGVGGFFETDVKGKHWIDLTTSSPSLMRKLADEFIALGGFPIDSPVTGSVDSAIRGDMILFVGGDDSHIEKTRPVLEAMGVVRKVGRYGNGYVAKLVNNQLWKIHAAAIGEAMVAAKVAGLEPEVWWEAMKGGAADSFVMQHDVPSIFAGHYDPSFPLALCLKDLGLIEELLHETGTRCELTRATHARFEEAKQRYGERAGEMSVCRLIEEDAGVALRVAGDWIPPWEVTPTRSQLLA
ncbi:NAD(P)-dependent oxidoreductase [Glaciimonas sp. CA11.2]|uniref:NAD(P)-dependent oxidoreductase n=1 Tax=unclassified Glaciimonas TaxID=2644401 RepID=UPI002AB55277|nr:MULTISPECIES: NAD(P)-dependent oxidoreductase [unclassified Glaciimonas]MDY7549148.1 NAD(P)-dependent oxidoreductase [Glaciimonas sp. CA11.2]MEB0013978.1 NAD(P)-dependent oxidoreductase [Glaciimonas sp. Cout2]MEB0083183.1 NAD(P)-dependent oxidoreductase [Glaciimonas sp. Gout2]MEB0161717.1 NAD(P)-dependent oxidoreductase [Glaciimonas sp. CA11.2]